MALALCARSPFRDCRPPGDKCSESRTLKAQTPECYVGISRSFGFRHSQGRRRFQLSSQHSDIECKCPAVVLEFFDPVAEEGDSAGHGDPNVAAKCFRDCCVPPVRLLECRPRHAEAQKASDHESPCEDIAYGPRQVRCSKVLRAQDAE